MQQFGSGVVDRIKGEESVIIIPFVGSRFRRCGINGSNYYYRFTRHAMIHEYEYENKGARALL